MADKRIRGELIRGPNDELYCIPDDLLKKLLIPDKHEDLIEAARKLGGTAQFEFSRATLKSEGDIEGTAMDIFGIEWERLFGQ